jgi:recombinational DNA repair ATPase RecF
MNEFQKLVDELEPIVRQRAARNRAIRDERDRRLARQAFEVEMERLHSRIRSGRSAFAKSLAPMVKALGDMQADAKIQAAADQAQRESREREAKAAKLKEILAAVDKGIADGSLTAEQVALLENKIHAAVQRIGAA